MRTSDPRDEPKIRARRSILIAAAALLLAGCIAVFIFIRGLEAEPPIGAVGAATTFRRDASIVFLSGDTGLRRWSLGAQVARRLAADDYLVIGLDSLAAFSKRKTPDQAGALVATAIRQASGRNPGVPIILIGQSFGSDITPIAMEHLPPALRRTVSRIILIVPGTHAYLQVSPEEVAGLARPDVALAPLARTLPPVPVTCIFGVEETDSLCPAIKRLPDATVIGMPGGHALHRDADGLFAILSRALHAPAGTKI